MHVGHGSGHLPLERDLHSVPQNDYKQNAVALIETAVPLCCGVCRVLL